jgi:AcrR family transcriptional regulator
VETRERILEAAARLYGQHGYLGATTRRIAEEAEVSEVTLFRLFGTKEAVLEEAIRSRALGEPLTLLPAEPEDPVAELTAWCASEVARFRRSRDLLRSCFADTAERPGFTQVASTGPVAAARELTRWSSALARRGALAADADIETAVGMLTAALFSDGLAREEMKGVHPASRSKAPERYARTFLRAIGATSGSDRSDRGPRAPSRGRRNAS